MTAPTSTRQTMNYQQARALIRDDMQRVEQLMLARLKSEVVLINQLSHYIVGSGGKRLRQQLVLLAAKAAGYRGDQHIAVAVIIEFIHTATLLHDDVVDASQMRRGNDTANAVWGNEAAVLVGDFLYSRSFEMMVEVGNMRVMEILANTTNIIAEGEVLQLLNINDPDISEATYLQVIHAKTAKLFEAATRLGAVLAGLNTAQEHALAAYGAHLGTAFQLIDDVMDYSGDAETMGKNVGDDLDEGKPTLPLIIAMQRGNPKQVQLIRRAIEKGGKDTIDDVLAAIDATNALDASHEYAERESQRAIDCLAVIDDSKYKRALKAVATEAIARGC